METENRKHIAQPEPKPGLVAGRHKWGESFKHDDGRYWQRCKKCGIWKIYLMCEAYYSKAGDFFEAKKVREPCH